MKEHTQDQLGVCSWSLQPDTPSELAERVCRTGLKTVQLALNPLRESPEIWGDVGERVSDAGVTIASGMFEAVGEDYSTLESIRTTGGITPDENWEQNWVDLQVTADIAAGLGLNVISFHAGFIPEDPASADFAAMVERMRRIGELFSKQGCRVLMESGQETAETLLAFLEALGRETVGVNFDPANIVLYDMGDPIESLRLLLPHVKQVHIKDAVRTKTSGTWGTEVPVGEGEVDWPAFVNDLCEADFRGSMIVEREAGDDRVGDIRKAAAVVSRVMAAGA